MQAPELMSIYFSDVFQLDTDLLEDYGAFDVSLVNDLPLFIDPFLLFNSRNPEYQDLHEQVITYLEFLRNKSIDGPIPVGLLKAWFTFPEVRETWLGYSLQGNRGRGLGMDFARALNANLSKPSANFGDQAVTQGSHIEKICLVSDGVGRDNISDLVTNLIKHHLLTFTETFAQRHLRASQRRVASIAKTIFNYDTETWETRRYELPFVNGRHVILTPIDLLTKDEVWINRDDLVKDYPAVAAAIPNDQVRAQINNYFHLALENIRDRDERRRKENARRRATREHARERAESRREPSQRQLNEAAAETISQYPEFVDHYIRWKEEHGHEAETRADERVRSSERLYIGQVRTLTSVLARLTGFYKIPGTTLDEARERVLFLKEVIENQGGHRYFYADGKPVRTEADLHIMFRLTWCNTTADVNREVNNGRGPSDFEVSHGRYDKALVEFKLARSTSLAKNLQFQTDVYQKAGGAQAALMVIVFFTREEELKARGTIAAVGRKNDPNVYLIDARDDNKPSGSKADSRTLS